MHQAYTSITSIYVSVSNKRLLCVYLDNNRHIGLKEGSGIEISIPSISDFS